VGTPLRSCVRTLPELGDADGRVAVAWTLIYKSECPQGNSGAELVSGFFSTSTGPNMLSCNIVWPLVSVSRRMMCGV